MTTGTGISPAAEWSSTVRHPLTVVRAQKRRGKIPATLKLHLAVVGVCGVVGGRIAGRGREADLRGVEAGLDDQPVAQTGRAGR